MKTEQTNTRSLHRESCLVGLAMFDQGRALKKPDVIGSFMPLSCILSKLGIKLCPGITRQINTSTL